MGFALLSRFFSSIHTTAFRAREAIFGRFSEVVADSESLGRFVTSSSWLDKSDPDKPRIKPNAFLPYPNPGTGRLETSVYRVDGWPIKVVKQCGDYLVAELEEKYRSQQKSKGVPYPEGTKTKRLYGAAFVNVVAAREADLNVVTDEPPRLHAVIVEWIKPTGNKKADESVHLLRALKIAAKSDYVVL